MSTTTSSTTITQQIVPAITCVTAQEVDWQVITVLLTMCGIVAGFVIALICVRIYNWHGQGQQAHQVPNSAIKDAWQVHLSAGLGADEESKADDKSQQKVAGTADSEHRDFEASLPGKLDDSFSSHQSIPSLHEACMSYISESSTTTPMDEKSALTLVSLANSDLETLTSLHGCSGETLEVEQFLRNLLGHCRVFRDFGLTDLLVSEHATQRFLERKMYSRNQREGLQRQRELENEQLQEKVWSLSHQLMNVERVREELLEKCGANSGMPKMQSEEVKALRKHLAQALAEFSRLEELRKQDAEAAEQKQHQVDRLEGNEKRLQAELASLRKTIEEERDQVDRLEGSEARLHAELASLKQTLDQKRDQEERLEGNEKRLHAELASLKKTLEQKQGPTAALSQNVDDHNHKAAAEELAAFRHSEEFLKEKFRLEQLRCKVLGEQVDELQTRVRRLQEPGKELLQQGLSIDGDSKIKALQLKVNALEEELQRSRGRYKELNVFKLDVIARELMSFERKLESQRSDIQLLRRTSTKQLKDSDDQDWLALRCIDLVASCRELKSHVQDVIHKCLSETQKLHIGAHLDEPRKAGQLSHGGWLSGIFEEAPGPSDWIVTSDSGLVVRAAPESEASVQGYLDFCTAVRGEAAGDWLKLADDRGYVMLNSQNGPLLKCSGQDDYTGSKAYYLRQKDEMLREQRLKRREGFEHPASN